MGASAESKPAATSPGTVSAPPAPGKPAG
jgi:hypothetical protein